MRSEPGGNVAVAIHASRAPGRLAWVVSRTGVPIVTRRLATALFVCSGGIRFIFAGESTGGDHPIVRRIEAVRVPKISFTDATSSDILEFVRIKFRDWESEPDPTRRG